MKKTEMEIVERETWVWYCDHCGKKIEGGVWGCWGCRGTYCDDCRKNYMINYAPCMTICGDCKTILGDDMRQYAEDRAVEQQSLNRLEEKRKAIPQKDASQEAE